jgi:hypothetical protein
MKYLFHSFALLMTMMTFAQKPCDFTTDVKDSLGTYKSTKEYLLYEKNFAGNSNYIFATMVVTDGMPILNVQFIEKNSGFIKAKCFDTNSKVYLQLNNNKIVTLIHIDEESCGTMVRDDKGLNNRILTGYFVFRKEDYADLKSSPISFIRIKYATDVADFILKKELNAELDGKTYQPDTYFINYFHCLEGAN